MSTAIALALPRLRRFRRPPARVVLHFIYTAISCMCCLYWIFVITLSVRGVALGGLPTGFKAAALALTLIRLAANWTAFRAIVKAWLADRAIAPVQRREWYFPGFFFVAIPICLISVFIEAASK